MAPELARKVEGLGGRGGTQGTWILNLRSQGRGTRGRGGAQGTWIADRGSQTLRDSELGSRIFRHMTSLELTNLPMHGDFTAPPSKSVAVCRCGRQVRGSQSRGTRGTGWGSRRNFIVIDFYRVFDFDRINSALKIMP